ncbi:hypothetical protein DRP53_05075 [candidate division WOR-3 bacterium]|uniref:Uncharacterized protein n=1 Tax=candidate division WOR-3 bacterium TaxID=2052148 RepID=A0A660SHW3_UNCW3|nr:MAG: hypothetical protein DRP53_05075 [candidate division WOR-3 bacterium]
MRVNIPVELIFTIAVLVLAVSLILYGLIIKRLLVLIRKGSIWLFPLISAAILIIQLLIHSYRMISYFPRLGTAGRFDFFPLIVGSFSLGRWEAFLFLIAGILSVVTGFLYYHWSTR